MKKNGPIPDQWTLEVLREDIITMLNSGEKYIKRSRHSVLEQHRAEM